MATSNLNGKRVLVVDDYPDITDMYAVLLREEGYNVSCASSGSEACQMLDGVNVVVTDLHMPNGDGFMVIAKCREFSIPVIMVAAAPPDTAARAKKAGAMAFLCKPVKFHELLAAISEALSIHSVAGELPAHP